MESAEIKLAHPLFGKKRGTVSKILLFLPPAPRYLLALRRSGCEDGQFRMIPQVVLPVALILPALRFPVLLKM